MHLSSILLSLELHFLSIYKRPIPNIDIFTDKVELKLKNGNIFYTLPYTINFLALINHYIGHIEGSLFEILFNDKHIFINNYLQLEELYLFYNKYKSFININMLFDIAIQCDTIDNIKLVNHHFENIYNEVLFDVTKPIVTHNANNNIRLAVRKYLLTLPLNVITDKKSEDIIVDFYKSINYDPSKIIYLYAGQIFKEKLFISSYGILHQIYPYPDYTILFDGKNLNFRMNISKEYFSEKYMAINFIVQKDNGCHLFKLYHEFFADCSVRKYWYNEIISAINIKLNKNIYEINILLENIDFKMLRYNLFIGNIDIFYWYKDYFATCNTPDVLDITKCCELHLED